jgi:hypothetical protein
VADDNIRVNGIAPGIIKTKFSSVLRQQDEIAEATLATIPAGQVGSGQVSSVPPCGNWTKSQSSLATIPAGLVGSGRVSSVPPCGNRMKSQRRHSPPYQQVRLCQVWSGQFSSASWQQDVIAEVTLATIPAGQVGSVQFRLVATGRNRRGDTRHHTSRSGWVSSVPPCGNWTKSQSRHSPPYQQVGSGQFSSALWQQDKIVEATLATIPSGQVRLDEADAEWIVISRPLRGHNDTPFGWPTPGHPQGVFGVFSYY